MSEPDGTPRRRPPTIDLTAKEVETEKPTPAPETAAANPEPDGAAAGPAPGEPSSRHFFRLAGGLRRGVTASHAVGAAAGAIIIAALLAGLWFADLLPSHGAAPAPAAVSGAAVSSVAPADQTSTRLDKIEAALAGTHPDAALAARVAAAEATTKSLDNSLAALNRRLDEVAVSAGTALAHADSAATAAAASKSAAQAAAGRNDLVALNNRIAALDSEVKALSESVQRRMASAEDHGVRMSVAAEALQASVERGAPYEAELSAVKSLGADASATTALAPFATDGIPSAAALGRELSALVPALSRASGAVANESSFLGRLEAHAQNLVRITPVDAPPGNDAAALVTRIGIDAARGDVAAALADIARLPEAAHAVAENWVEKATAREAALAASRRIAADALASLSRPALQ
jgi:hypothetical protein